MGADIGGLEEKVILTLKLKDMFSNRAKHALRSVISLNEKAARSSQVLARLSTRQFQALGNNIKQFNQAQKRTSQQLVSQKVLATQNAVALKSMFESRMITRVRLLSQRMKQFKMELLGIMFFGMMIQKTMFGLLRPAGEAVGLTEIWTTTLKLLFLPIMLALLPMMIMFMEWFIDAPEWLKLAIGGIVLFIGSLGALLFTYGATSLGLRALMADLPTFFKLFSSFKASNTFKDIFIKGEFVKGFKALEKSMAARNISMLVGIGISIYWLKTIKEMMSDVETAWSTRVFSILGGLFGGAFLGFKVGGVGGAIVGATIGFGISIVLNLLDIAWEHGVDQKMIEGFAGIKQFFLDAWEKATRNWGSETYIDAKGTLRGFDSVESSVKRTSDSIQLAGGKASTAIDSSFNNMELSAEDLASVFNISLTKAEGILSDLKDFSGDFSIDFSENMESAGDSVEKFSGRVLHSVKKLNLNSYRGQMSPEMFAHGGGSAFGGQPLFSGAGHSSTPEGGFLGGFTAVQDFIWRAGQGVTKISPNDNLIGTKGGMSSGSGINVTQNISVTASNKDEIDRLIQDNNSRLVDDLRRMTGA